MLFFSTRLNTLRNCQWFLPRNDLGIFVSNTGCRHRVLHDHGLNDYTCPCQRPCNDIPGRNPLLGPAHRDWNDSDIWDNCIEKRNSFNLEVKVRNNHTTYPY